MSIRRFFRRAQWDRERLAEIESHVQTETDENIARGMLPDEALDAARRKFGNVTLIREEIYRMNTVNFVETILQDVRFGLRTLRQNPTFTLVALVTLAVGIGANTAVFSVVNSVLVKPLPYPNPEQLVAVRQLAPGAAGLGDLSDGLLLSPSMYRTYSAHNRSFQSMGVFNPDTAGVTGIGEPEQVRIVGISDGILQTLAVFPALGRWLSEQDQIPNGPRNLMLGYGYWQRRFGGSPSVIGSSLRVDNNLWQIVGVMPSGFRVVDADFDLLTPLRFPRQNLALAGFGFRAVARLKAGISIGQANADILRLIAVWMDSWTNGPGSNPHFYEQWKITPAIRPLQKDITGSVGNVLWLVMGTIALVMFIACANVTNLMLVRVEARQQELAVRAALGASWARILGILLTESAMLGLLGGFLSIAIAYGGLKLLVSIGPGQLPRLNEVSLDSNALAFTFVLAILSSLFLSLIPALRYFRPRLAESLRRAGRTASASRERHRTRNVLVVAQVALALVLLISAGLMIRTFQALHSVSPGFSGGSSLETMWIEIPESLVADPERVARMQNDIVEKFRGIPGVTAAAFGSQMPMQNLGSDWDEVLFEDHPVRRNTPQPLRLYKYASPEFFRTAGTRLLAGREIGWNDIYGHRQVALISENLAREVWGSPGAAVGKHLQEFPTTPWFEIIGVVENVRENGVAQDAPETVYWPTLMNYMFGNPKLSAKHEVTFVIRSQRAGTGGFLEEAQRAVWSVEPRLPIGSVQTMQQIYNESLARPSFTLVMLAIAGTMALVLGVVGVYGVVSYSVSQRRREIGIRMALGAQNRELKAMFVWSALRVAMIGAALGLALAFGLTRFMKSLVFEISPLDPMTFIAVPILLVIATMPASYLPARRAASLSPSAVLKDE